MHPRQFTGYLGFVIIGCMMCVIIFRSNYTTKIQVQVVEEKRIPFFAKYRQCVLDGAYDAGRAQLWWRMRNITETCEKKTSLRRLLRFKELQNNDEIKLVKLFSVKLKPSDECNVITLGIGNDVKAEVQLSNLIPKQCNFSGADPIQDKNRQAYEIVGKYFEMAVGATDGIRTASVLGYNGIYDYRDVNMTHVNLVKFLKDHVKVEHIVDYLLMDNELAEYDLLPFFLPGGQLDSNGITVCQWNCEFHETDETNRRKLATFMFTNLAGGKYLPSYTFENKHPKHLRMVLTNVADEICLKRFWNEYLN